MTPHLICPTLPPFEKLVRVMEILRAPDGCSWDREQTHRSLRKYVLEEANEVAEAIDENDPLHLCEELGDLMMIVVFHAQIAAEAGTFTIREVANGIVEKLISRHPHVFAEREGLTSASVVEKWQTLKAEEKKKKQLVSSKMKETQKFASAIPMALNIQNLAAEVGFDFPDTESAMSKLEEELEEIKAARKTGKKSVISGEIGDLLFSVLNVARLLKINPEEALKKTSEKFIRRFSKVEKHFSAKGGLKGKSIKEMDQQWDKAKKKPNPEPKIAKTARKKRIKTKP